MDTLEQRLVADLTDAAEAAMADGLTPPDRAAVEATVARRRRTRRVRVALATAAVTLVVVGAVAALVGGDGKDRTEMHPADTTVPTAPPSTTQPESPTTTAGTPRTTTSSTASTAPEAPPDTPATTPNDPEAPVPEPITVADLEAITVPFSQGLENLPPVCRDYWATTGRTPADDGFAADANAIVVDPPGEMAIGQIDGDGVADGVTTFSCVTGGTTPPSGIVAILAAERTYTFDDGTLGGEASSRFGADFAMTDNVFAYVEAGPSWQVMANVNLVMPGDPTCCPSQVVDAYYRLGDGVLELHDLIQEAGQGG